MGIIQKILVAVDFSDYSQEATRYACELAKQQNASVTLLHVHQVIPATDPMGYASLDSRIFESLREAAEESLQKAKEEALKLYPKVDTLLVVGIPFETIVNVAKDRRYDLIIVGTHGRTGIRHALIGSVAERVVRHAPCPVLVVRRS